MQLVLWFIAGASAGYLAGLTLFDDEGVGVPGHIVLGAIFGILSGLATAAALGTPHPMDTFEPLAVAAAAVIAGVGVVVVNELAERRQLGV